MEYQVTTAVDAPPEQIWPLFLDIERWPQMTKSISEVHRLDSGPIHVGSEAMVRQPRLPRARWRVTEMESNHSFIWETASAGVTTSGGHVVTATEQGSELTLTLRMTGPAAGLMSVLLGRITRRYLAMEMDGFRRTAESARA
jgi:uncharacterized membrane protein